MNHQTMLGMEDISQYFNSLPLSQPDPLVLELTRLQNLLKEKDNELSAAQNEIKALRATEARKEKALGELKTQHDKLNENLRIMENALQEKKLEMKKLVDEKKEAVAAQYAAEAALRRLHADQKDDDPLPIESIIAPLEAQIKMLKHEIASLQGDNKALERLSKSKEAALLETERILKCALDRALVVEEIQNQNLELRRHIEICQEENRILEKANRQKVLEVEKLTQTIHELEEAVLAGGATANVVRDYQRLISELNEEKRTLERELARAKVSANRVATVVANEWKDESEKVMPVKLWLEERRVLQAEMQRLKDKLVVTERTAKAEAQLKDKLKLRLRTLEEGLKNVFNLNGNVNLGQIGTTKTSSSHLVLAFVSNNVAPKKRSSSQPRASITSSKCSPLRQPQQEKANNLDKQVVAENPSRKSLRGSKSIGLDRCDKENSKFLPNTEMSKLSDFATQEETKFDQGGNEDVVSGFLYDTLQREVINLRKVCQVKEDGLTAKDEEIKILIRKVDTLTKAVEVEARKAKMEASLGRKTTGLASKEDNKKPWGKSLFKRVTKSS